MMPLQSWLPGVRPQARVFAVFAILPTPDFMFHIQALRFGAGLPTVASSDFCVLSKRQKVTPLLFAGLISKKGQAKLALFWSKGNVTPLPDGFCLGSTRFEARLCLVSNPKQTSKK
jgi:hypothetical protein